MVILLGVMFGLLIWFAVRYGLGGFYTVGPSERAVLTTFGRAQGLGPLREPDESLGLRPEERERYTDRTGSVYIRKVHFRDALMISQIEQKAVNRLRQVTAAIQQDGQNRVNVIRSGAEREAAGELGKAAAMRPNIVGAALSGLASDQELCDALFDVLEAQNLLRNAHLNVSMVPRDPSVLASLEAARNLARPANTPPPTPTRR